MATFKNNFSWSYSRSSTLSDGCPMKYLYNYYRYWYGWNRNADEYTRKIYRLKNLANLHSWSGNIVHDVIKRTLKEFKSGIISKVSLNDMHTLAKEVLRTDYISCINREYESNPKKHCNLSEVYYNKDGKMSKDDSDKVKDITYTCLDNFHTCDEVRKGLFRTHTENWKPIDELTKFEMDGETVWLAIDFAYEDDNGILHILDWKCGRVKDEDHAVQLGVYAMYAHETWGYAIDKIKVKDVYLMHNVVKEYNVTQEMVDSAKKYIQSSMEDMKSYLIDVEENIPDETKFTANPTRFACSYCNYKEICPDCCVDFQLRDGK